ncbi:MAG: PPOX class F420-dependent oxidoreductase [Thermomicrobiales bacterium]
MPVSLDPKVRAFLEEKRFGVLATVNRDGTAQQTVMWYELRDGHVMMNTARGRTKDRNLLRDRRISICVEDGTRFVTIAGTAELNDDQDVAQADIKALATRYDGAAHAEKVSAESFSKQHRITVILPIEQVIAHGFDD